MMFLTGEQEQVSDRLVARYGLPQFIADALAAAPYCYRCVPPRKLRAGRTRFWCDRHPHTIHPKCR